MTDYLDKCYNCGFKPDITGHDDIGKGYLVKVWSVSRQQEFMLCYGCFTALLDSDVYRKAREIMGK